METKWDQFDNVRHQNSRAMMQLVADKLTPPPTASSVKNADLF